MRTTFLFLWIVLAACTWAQPQAPRHSNMDEALALYGELTGKTVLRPSLLPAVDASTELPSPDSPEYRRRAPEAIVERFERVGIIFETLGDKFVVVAPEGSTSGFPPPPPSVSVEEDEGSYSFPKGSIHLPGVELDEVLKIYADLSSRTILRPASLPACTIHLRTESDLTLEETIYAMDVVFALNGIAVVDDGERFVQVVPLSIAPRTDARSPGRNPTDELIEARSIPKFNGRLLSARRSSNFVAAKAAQLKPASAERMLQYYATLSQVSLVPSQRFSKVPVVFYATTSLTKPEILYALQTVLGLNHLAIHTSDDGSITLVPASN